MEEVIDRKQRVGEDACQNDIRHEGQGDRDTQDSYYREQNAEENTFLFQLVLPYAALAPKTACT